MHPYAGIVVSIMLDKDKAKESASFSQRRYPSLPGPVGLINLPAAVLAHRQQHHQRQLLMTALIAREHHEFNYIAPSFTSLAIRPLYRLHSGLGRAVQLA